MNTSNHLRTNAETVEIWWSLLCLFRPSTLFFTPIASSSVFPYLFQGPFSRLTFYQLIPCFDLCNVKQSIRLHVYPWDDAPLAQTSTCLNVIMATAVPNGQSQPVSVIRHSTYLVFVIVSWPGRGMPVAAATGQPS